MLHTLNNRAKVLLLILFYNTYCKAWCPFDLHGCYSCLALQSPQLLPTFTLVSNWLYLRLTDRILLGTNKKIPMHKHGCHEQKNIQLNRGITSTCDWTIGIVNHGVHSLKALEMCITLTLTLGFIYNLGGFKE